MNPLPANVITCEWETPLWKGATSPYLICLQGRQPTRIGSYLLDERVTCGKSLRDVYRANDAAQTPLTTGWKPVWHKIRKSLWTVSCALYNEPVLWWFDSKSSLWSSDHRAEDVATFCFMCCCQTKGGGRTRAPAAPVSLRVGILFGAVPLLASCCEERTLQTPEVHQLAHLAAHVEF